MMGLYSKKKNQILSKKPVDGKKCSIKILEKIFLLIIMLKKRPWSLNYQDFEVRIKLGEILYDKIYDR